MKTFGFLLLALMSATCKMRGAIADKYPGDVGIRNDPAVLLFDDFEDAQYSDGLSGTALQTALQTSPAHWSRLANNPNLAAITTAQGEFFSGSKGLKLTLLGNSSTEQQVTLEKCFTSYLNNTSVTRNPDPKYRRLYLRWYQKWQSDYFVPKGNHNGGSFTAGYRGRGTGGRPPVNGSGWYTFLLQNNYQGQTNPLTGDKDVFGLEDSPFCTFIYAYWPGRAGDHMFASGNVRGAGNISGCTAQFPCCGGQFTMWNDTTHFPHFNPPYQRRIGDFRPNKNQWYCYELMLKVNTLGAGDVPNHDGEVMGWVDGKLILHFTDLFMMGSSNGTPYYIDRARINLQSNATKGTAVKFHDNIVIATDYIGPMAAAKPSPTTRQQQRRHSH